MKGWIYVITNEAMPGLIKVGYSMKDPELRAAELNHTGAPHPYVVDYEVLVEEPRDVEQMAHGRLRGRREGKEWFRCSVEEAIAEIRAAVGSKVQVENFKRADRVKAEKIEQKNAEAERACRKAEEELQQQEAILNEKREEISSRYDRMTKAVLPNEKFWETFSGVAILLALVLSAAYPNASVVGHGILAAIGGILIASAIKAQALRNAKNSPQYKSIISAREAELAEVERRFNGLHAKKIPDETVAVATTSIGIERTTSFDVVCKKCGARFAFKLTRDDLGARCPECSYLNRAPQRVGGNFKVQLREEALDLRPEVRLMGDDERSYDRKISTTTPDGSRSVQPVLINFLCPYCGSRKQMEDSHLISCPSCGRSSFTR